MEKIKENQNKQFTLIDMNQLIEENNKNQKKLKDLKIAVAINSIAILFPYVFYLIKDLI